MAVIVVVYDTDAKVVAVVKQTPSGVLAVARPTWELFRVGQDLASERGTNEISRTAAQLAYIASVRRSPYLSPAQKAAAEDLILSVDVLDSLSSTVLNPGDPVPGVGVVARIADGSGKGSYPTVIYYIDP